MGGEEGDDPNGQNDRTDLEQENQLISMSPGARESDLDLVRRSPYRPAGSGMPHYIGLTEDRTRSLAHRTRNFLHRGRQPQKKKFSALGIPRVSQHPSSLVLAGMTAST